MYLSRNHLDMSMPSPTALGPFTIPVCPGNSAETTEAESRNSASVSFRKYGGTEVRSVLYDRPNDRDELALDFDIVGPGVNWLHGDIGRLESHAIVLVIELLERRFLFVLEPNGNGVAVFTGLLMAEQDDIPIVDERIDHRMSLDSQCEEIAAAVGNELGAQLDRLAGLGALQMLRQRDWQSGGKLAD